MTEHKSVFLDLEFDFEGNLAGVPHTWYLSGQSIGPHYNNFHGEIYYYFFKQELYLVKENYEIFSTEVSAREKQGQNNNGSHLNGRPF